LFDPFKFEKKLKMDFTILDVRTPAEFAGGHVAGSINIPLNEVEQKLAEIKALKQPIILCCASGGRSGQATYFLKNQGLDCENGGSWLDVNYQINK
jgi:rhodanese-related sulfurtransferase